MQADRGSEQHQFGPISDPAHPIGDGSEGITRGIVADCCWRPDYREKYLVGRI